MSSDSMHAILLKAIADVTDRLNALQKQVNHLVDRACPTTDNVADRFATVEARLAKTEAMLANHEFLGVSMPATPEKKKSSLKKPKAAVTFDPAKPKLALSSDGDEKRLVADKLPKPTVATAAASAPVPAPVSTAVPSAAAAAPKSKPKPVADDPAKKKKKKVQDSQSDDDAPTYKKGAHGTDILGGDPVYDANAKMWTQISAFFKKNPANVWCTSCLQAGSFRITSASDGGDRLKCENCLGVDMLHASPACAEKLLPSTLSTGGDLKTHFCMDCIPRATECASDHEQLFPMPRPMCTNSATAARVIADHPAGGSGFTCFHCTHLIRSRSDLGAGGRHIGNSRCKELTVPLCVHASATSPWCDSCHTEYERLMTPRVPVQAVRLKAELQAQANRSWSVDVTYAALIREMWRGWGSYIQTHRISTSAASSSGAAGATTAAAPAPKSASDALAGMKRPRVEELKRTAAAAPPPRFPDTKMPAKRSEDGDETASSSDADDDAVPLTQAHPKRAKRHLTPMTEVPAAAPAAVSSPPVATAASPLPKKAVCGTATFTLTDGSQMPEDISDDDERTV